jgi:hypothetical protein
MASIQSSILHGRKYSTVNTYFRFAHSTLKAEMYLSLISSHSGFKKLALTCILSSIASAAYSTELFEVLMDDAEHLESMSSVCINMHEDEYYQSDLCEHAAQAIYLLKLQELGDVNVLSNL